MPMPIEIEVKSILNKTKKRDPWFLDDYTINLYSGCSFNCLYCYIRGSKYGEHMERSLSVKMNAIEILDRQLFNKAKKGQYGIIVISSATDPYLQFEKEHELTRQALEVVLKHRFPVHIITKSDLVVRDFDLLHKIDQTAILPNELSTKLKHGTIITFSFSSIDDEINKIFEPGATLPTARLETLKSAKNEDFLTGVSMMPLLPYITDTTKSLNVMFSTFKKANADYVIPATIVLYGNLASDSKTLVLNAVNKHFPDLVSKYERFFSNSTEMPQYYQKAFYAKMKELGNLYQLPNRIV